MSPSISGESPATNLTYRGSVSGVAFSGDGEFAAIWGTMEDKGSTDKDAAVWIHVWSVDSGDQIERFSELDSSIIGVVFDQSGDKILTLLEDGKAQVWETTTGNPLSPLLQHGKYDNVDAVFNETGNRILISGGSFGISIRLNDLASDEPIAEYEEDFDERNLQSRIVGFSQDGTDILLLNEPSDCVEVWHSVTDEIDRKCLGWGKEPDLELYGAALDEQGKRVLMWGDTKDNTGTAVRAWLNESKKETSSASLVSVPNLLSLVADSERLLIWGSHEENIKSTNRERISVGVWNTEPNDASDDPDIQIVQGIAFSQDEQRISLLGADGTVRERGTEPNGVFLPVFRVGHCGRIDGALLSRDKGPVLTWRDDSAWMWDGATGDALYLDSQHSESSDLGPKPALRHTGPIRGGRISMDGTRVLLWGRYSPQEGDEDSDVVVHGDSMTLWAGSASGLRLVQDIQHGGEITGASFSADGRYLLTQTDGSRRVWDTDTGDELTPMLAKDEIAVGVGSSEEGARMLSWSGNGEIRVWDLDRGRGQMRLGEALLQALESETRANHRDPRKGGDREIELSTKTLVSARDTEHAGAGSTSVSSYQAPRVTILDNATQQTLSPAFPESFYPDDDGAIIGPNGRHLFAWSKGKKQVLVPTVKTVSISNSRTSVSGGYRTEEVGSEEAWLWDIESGTNAVTRLTTDFRNGTFSSDGKGLLAWSTDQLQLLDSKTGKRKTSGFEQGSGIAGAAFSTDDHWILSWNQGGSARVWDAATGDAVTAKLEHYEPIVLATFARGPHPRRALTQTVRGVSIWDIETAKSLTRSLRYPAPGRDGSGHMDGARRFPNVAASEPARDSDGLDAFVEWASEGAWPKSKLRLKLEVETGTELGPTDEIHPLSAAEWNRKKWCDYEVVRRCIGELPDEAWRRAQLRCNALAHEQQVAATGPLRAAYNSAINKLGFFRCP